MTQEQKQKLTLQLAELSKLSSSASRLVSSADAVMTTKLNKTDAELISFNLDKLKQVLEECEEVWVAKSLRPAWWANCLSSI